MFQAGLDTGVNNTPIVKIAGFEVANNNLTAGQNTNKISIGTESIYLGGNSFAQAPFGVTKTGELKATSGNIGGFDINSDRMVYVSTEANNGKYAGVGIAPQSGKGC